MLIDESGGAATVARESGTPASHLSAMLTGTRGLGDTLAGKLEKTYDKPTGWFDLPIDEAGPPAVQEGVGNYLSGAPGPDEKAVHVPLLANAGSMGDGNDEMHEDVLIGSIALSPDWITRRLRITRFQDLRFIHAYGDSMSDTFEDGDILLVNTGAKDPSGADGVYVLEASHRVFIKRVTERFGGTFEVTSDNPKVKAVDILDGNSPIQVRGRVVWCWNGKKL